MKSSKVFWGIFFILAAVYVVISKFGILPDIGVFSIILTVFFLWLFVEGIRNVNFWEILALTPWTVLGAAFLGSIGLSLIFGGKKRKWKTVTGNVGTSSSEQYTGEEIRCENSFGSAIRYINSDNFRRAAIENNFGSLSVYFDNAIVQEGSANVSVENNFGETNLYIPKEWKIQNNLDRSFGAIRETGSSIGTSSTVLYLNGSANFGEIHLHYI